MSYYIINFPVMQRYWSEVLAKTYTYANFYKTPTNIII